MDLELGTQNPGCGTCCLLTSVALQKSVGRRLVVLGTADAESYFKIINPAQRRRACKRHTVRCDLFCVLPEEC